MEEEQNQLFGEQVLVISKDLMRSVSKVEKVKEKKI